MEVQHCTGRTVSGQQMFLVTNPQSVHTLVVRDVTFHVLILILHFVDEENRAGILQAMVDSHLPLMLYDPEKDVIPCAAQALICGHCHPPAKLPWYSCLFPIAALVMSAVLCGLCAKKGPLVNVNVDKMVDLSLFKKEKEKEKKQGSYWGLFKKEKEKEQGLFWGKM